MGTFQIEASEYGRSHWTVAGDAGVAVPAALPVESGSRVGMAGPGPRHETTDRHMLASIIVSMVGYFPDIFWVTVKFPE